MPQPTKIEKRTTCPSCGNKGRSVSAVTMRALLNDEHIAPFEAKEHSCCESDGASADGCKPNREDTGWRFCDSANCDVVYFTERGEATFAKPDLRVEVGVKETTGERPLCYCFGHSVASIKQELLAKGESDALEDIREKMKSPGCRCETENPSGSCCLGSVAKGITIATDELGVAEVAADTKTSPARSSANRGELIAKAGTVVSAIMASACCWLPLVLLAVGVSGAGIAATLETYRPVFIVVTFGFLGAAFYFTYRPRGTPESGHGCCPTEPTTKKDCCAASSKRRLSMMTINKVMLWVVTVLAIGFLFFPSYVGALLGTGGVTQVTENMNTAVFKIDGMTCEGCASIAEKAIGNVSGVLAVEVDYDEGKAIVGTDASCPIPREAIIHALNGAGYSGTEIESEDAGDSDAQTKFMDLSADAAELQAAFNASVGDVRMVLIVSPG